MEHLGLVNHELNSGKSSCCVILSLFTVVILMWCLPQLIWRYIWVPLENPSTESHNGSHQVMSTQWIKSTYPVLKEHLGELSHLLNGMIQWLVEQHPKHWEILGDHKSFEDFGFWRNKKRKEAVAPPTCILSLGFPWRPSWLSVGWFKHHCLIALTEFLCPG